MKGLYTLTTFLLICAFGCKNKKIDRDEFVKAQVQQRLNTVDSLITIDSFHIIRVTLSKAISLKQPVLFNSNEMTV